MDVRRKCSLKNYHIMSSTQLEREMKKFEMIPDFTFLGVFPSDVYELPKYNTKYAGAIFNTSPLSKRGKHWVGIFISGKKVDFYDSRGKPPQKLIAKHFKTYSYNKRVDQQIGDVCCGVFVLEFFVKSIKNTFCKK